MARFTRAEIRRIIGEPCTDEMENSIIAMHIGVVDPLKDELQTLKADAAKVSDLEKEIERLKTLNTDAEGWKAKYEKEHTDFDEYKNNIDSEKQTENLKSLYKSLLKENKVDDKRIDSILKVTDFSTLKVGKDGKLENAKELSESIKNDWGDFIVKTETKGADIETPPANSGNKLTKEQIMEIKDTTARQKAIAENIELFN